MRGPALRAERQLAVRPFEGLLEPVEATEQLATVVQRVAVERIELHRPPVAAERLLEPTPLVLENAQVVPGLGVERIELHGVFDQRQADGPLVFRVHDALEQQRPGLGRGAREDGLEGCLRLARGARPVSAERTGVETVQVVHRLA